MVATKPITVEEFETMPLKGSWELIDGELVEVSPSAEEPSAISAAITGLLWQFVRTHKLGRVYTAEGGFVLFPERATVRAPDVAFVQADRVPHGEARKHFARLAPDLAVEVFSPSDRLADALAMIAMYLQAGVEAVWLVDPASRTIDESIAVLHETAILDGGATLPGFTIPVADIFAES